MSNNINQKKAGTIGGLTTLARHGREHYSRAGRMGGRPICRTLGSIFATASVAVNKNTRKGVKDGDTNLSDNDLLRLWHTRQSQLTILQQASE